MKKGEGERTSSNTSPKTRSAFGLCPGCSVVPGCPLLAPLLNMLANVVKKLVEAFGSLVLSEEDLLEDSLS